MSTDVMTPRRAGEAASRRDARERPLPGRQATQAPDARRPARPIRRPRTDRPAGPMLPASPVRPVSPPRPAGPGRPGRTIRTGGPARQLHSHERSGQQRRVRTGARTGRYSVRTPFVMLVLGLLSGGLVCLLVVNTTLAANSIEIVRLRQANSAGTERMQQLRQTVGAERSATVIARKARKLGMRPGGVPAFVDLRTRSLTGPRASEPGATWQGATSRGNPNGQNGADGGPGKNPAR